MSDIFISYAREDRERVAPIAKILASLGWSVWWDPNILSGAEFDEVIAKELKAARCVLVMWSAKSVESRWVRGEARDGLQRNIVVPAVLDAVELPLDFRAIHATDFSGWNGEPDAEPVAQLRDSIARVLDKPPNPEGPAILKRERAWARRLMRMRFALGGLALALLLVIALNLRSIGHGFEMALGTARALSNSHDITADFSRNLGRHQEILQSAVNHELAAYVERRDADSWGSAQLTAGADPNPAAEQSVFERVMPDFYRADCHCWATMDGGQHAVTTSWILLAHVSRGRAVEPETIENLISQQWADGSWPLYFDSVRDPIASSTYATLYIVLALNEYRRAGLASGDLVRRIDTAIAQAGAWLFAHRPPKGERWIDYPSARVRQVASRGVSALAVFTFLRVFNDERAQMVLEDWISGLGRPVAFDHLESSDQFLERQSKGAYHDATREVVFAWEMAALIAGYPHLGWRGRARAQEFFAEALRGWSLDAKTMNLEWMMAESVFALRLARASLRPASPPAK